METISKHELVPFTALMNMIKFNYLEKKEVFQTLLSILCDYDPTDEENKKRTTRYIEVLLTDQTELAEYLLSFLPNGMSVDHIGVAEVKGDNLKLKKKKAVTLHKTSTTSTSSGTFGKTVMSFQQPISKTKISFQTPVVSSGKQVVSHTSSKTVMTFQKPAISSSKTDETKTSSGTVMTFQKPAIPFTKPTVPNTGNKTVMTFQQAGASSTKNPIIQSKPAPPQVNLNIIQHTVYPADKTNITTSLSGHDGSTKGNKSGLEFVIKDQNENLKKILPNSNCNPRAMMDVEQPKINTVANTSHGITSNLPILYFNNANQTPVCPVVPSIKLHNVVPKTNISCTYPNSQCEWIQYDTNHTIHNQTKENSNTFSQNNQTTVNSNTFNQNKPSPPIVSTFPKINKETANLISSSADLLYDNYEFPSYNVPTENLHFVQQSEPILPNMRFPLYSAPTSNIKPKDVAFNRRPSGHDILSLINNPMDEHHYQPITFSNTNPVSYPPITFSNTNPVSYPPITFSSINTIVNDRHLYSNTRTLSAFPYTQEFVFPDGKTQNLIINRSGVQTDQHTYQNITKATSCNKNKPCLTYEKSSAPVYSELPRHDIMSTYTPPSTTIFNHNQVIAPQSFSINLQPQTNTRQFFAPPTQNLIPHNQPGFNFIDTQHDIITPSPMQYNHDPNYVDPGISNQEYEIMNQLNRPKPKKVPMSANSSVRKKLRLIPNNTNTP